MKCHLSLALDSKDGILTVRKRGLEEHLWRRKRIRVVF